MRPRKATIKDPRENNQGEKQTVPAGKELSKELTFKLKLKDNKSTSTQAAGEC